MRLNYKFSDIEIKKLLEENMVIICDSREQKNEVILDYFKKHNIKHVTKKLNSGDYGVKLLAAPELGLPREIYFPVMIEKKNSIDELAGSFKDRTRFEAEFVRATSNKLKIYLLVEENQGYENLINHKYRSEYGPKALLGSLKTFESRYGFTTVFLDKKYSGNWIYHTLRYYVYETLRE